MICNRLNNTSAGSAGGGGGVIDSSAASAGGAGGVSASSAASAGGGGGGCRCLRRQFYTHTTLTHTHIELGWRLTSKFDVCVCACVHLCLCVLMYACVYLHVCTCAYTPVHQHQVYRVATTHRMPYLNTSFSAKEPYN